MYHSLFIHHQNALDAGFFFVQEANLKMPTLVEAVEPAVAVYHGFENA